MSKKKDFSTIQDAVVNAAKGTRTFITGIDTEAIARTLMVAQRKA